MSETVTGVLALVGSYFLAGIPVGLLVGRAHGIDDIRQHGSGNIGASNVLRVLGVKVGLAVWLMDVLKGYLPLAVARYGLGLEGWWLAAVGLTAIIGHCFSAYLRLTGGKGVATSLGVIVGLHWLAGLICFGIWLVVVAGTRYISLGSMLGSGLSGLIMWLCQQPLPSIVACLLLGALVVQRHQSNIGRLIKGTERKIGRREESSEEAGKSP
jgi:glycerol-3-phosphate acyltransferase PlsY